MTDEERQLEEYMYELERYREWEEEGRAEDAERDDFLDEAKRLTGVVPEPHEASDVPPPTDGSLIFARFVPGYYYLCYYDGAKWVQRDGIPVPHTEITWWLLCPDQGAKEVEQ